MPLPHPLIGRVIPVVDDTLFVTRWRGLSYVLRPEVKKASPSTGELYVAQKKIKIKFEPDAVPRWAEDQALSALNVTGLAEGESPRQFMGCFDVDEALRERKIDPEDRDWVFARMVDLAGPDTWVQIVKPKTAAPLPNFDELSPSRLIALLSEGGFDLEQALAYELENQCRGEVLDRIRAAIAKRGEQPVEELIQA